MSDSARYHACLWAEGKTREEVAAEITQLENAKPWKGVEFDDARVRHMAQTRLETLRAILADMEAAQLATTAQLADAFEAAGIRSPFATPHPRTLLLAPAAHYGQAVPEWADVPAIVELAAGMADGWMVEVHEEMGRRALARARQKRLERIQQLDTTPAVRAFLVDQVDARGAAGTELKVVDLRDWAKSAQGHRTARGCQVEPYRPEPGCQASLKLGQAVHFAYAQESYADHQGYAVPVALASDADVAVCKRNLARFCAALRTATGYAGEGSTYSAELVITEVGAVVHFDVRHSVAD